MTERKFDPDWPHGHVTRDGRKARVICKNRLGDCPIVILVESFSGLLEDVLFVNGNGRGICCDIQNAPAPKRKVHGWMNVYSIGDIYTLKSEADEEAGDARAACIYVEFEEGEGL